MDEYEQWHFQNLTLSNQTFQNFTIDDGLQSNQFYWNAYYKGSLGGNVFWGH